MAKRSATNSKSAPSPEPVVGPARRREAGKPLSEEKQRRRRIRELRDQRRRLELVAAQRSRLAAILEKPALTNAEVGRIRDGLRDIDRAQDRIKERLLDLTGERHDAFAYVSGYIVGALEHDKPGLPKEERWKPGSPQARRGQKALVSRLLALAARNHGPDYGLLLGLAAHHDPEPRRDNPYEDGWEFVLRRRKNVGKKKHLEHSKIARHIYEVARSGRLLTEAKEEAVKKFGLQEDQIAKIWRRQGRLLQEVYGKLPRRSPRKWV